MNAEGYIPRISDAVSKGLLGAWLVALVLLALTLCGILSKGETSALTLFSGTTGILSSAVLERLAFKQQQKVISPAILTINAIMIAVMVFILGGSFL